MLAAHFLRAGRPIGAAVCLALPLFLLLRRHWAKLVVQMALLAGSGLWLWTMLEIAESRAQSGQPAGRMIAILTGVAAFTLMAGVILHWSDRND